MPGHIFLKVGDYTSALDVARRSVDMDVQDLKNNHPGRYAATRYYHGHNVSFLLVSLTELGQYSQALDAAEQSGSASFVARQLIANQQWTDILRTFPTASTVDVAFARGLANAALRNLSGAEDDLSQIPTADPQSASYTDTLQAMTLALKARIAEQRGDNDAALSLLTESGRYADLGDSISVAEFPAMYFYSPHLALGASQKNSENKTSRKRRTARS
jgi:tetratricopeptide (TPR) repeat protein